MTGVNINKIRHYAPGFNSRTTRLDADAAALIFKAGNAVISKSERLIADVSVKAAMPMAGDSDGKKRGPESSQSSKYVNYMGVVFDPNGKKTEGSYFKHYVTESERIEALRSPEPRPNWGWIDPNEPGNRLPSPVNAVAKLTRFPVNPKTGEPMKNFGFEPEIKGLGPTIGEKNPGGKIAARAARALGLVIDAMGRFRCPPGLFTANRFTNERGEGCFGVSPAQIQDIASSLTNILQAPNDRVSLINGLAAIGVSVAEIRKAYREDGIDGLQGLASRAGLKQRLVGDAAKDASYMSTVVAKIRERLEGTKGAPARMEKIRDEKNRIINDLKAKYGITEPDEYLALGQIFKKMSEGDDAVFAADQFEALFMGGNPENHEQWVIAETIRMHKNAIARKTGITDPAKMLEAYYEAKFVTGEITPLTRFIDASIEREKSVRIGAFKQILVEAAKNPSTMRSPTGKPIKIEVDHSRWKGLGEFTELNGAARPESIYIGSGPAIQGYRGDGPPPGYYDLYEATGGDIDDQWRAITEAMDGDEKSRRWVHTYATDLAAEMGKGWEDFGAQTATHEMTHIKQYQAIIDYFRATRPDEDFDSMGNDELWNFISEFLDTATPEQTREVFGIDLDELIEKRIDALAGVYSQDIQQNALEALAKGDPVNFNRTKNIALLETLAELNANRSIGLIGEDPEVDEFLDSYIFNKEPKDGIPTRRPSGLIIPGEESVHWGELIVPGAPPVPSGGELIIPGRRPDVPVDAPVPAKPSKPGKTYTPLPSSAPPLPPGAGRVIPQSRPSSGGRTPKGPKDPFERERNGKVPRMIRENRFTNQDIEEHLYGEDGKGGLFAMFRSARNMRISANNRRRDEKKKELLNNLIDTMGISFEELESMARKAQNGEQLTPEEKQKLVAAITHLRNGANEFKRKAEEARERYRNYKPIPEDPRNQWDDVSVNRANREQIQEEIEMYESLFARVGRGFAPAVHDILTISENGPYPDRLGAVPMSEQLRLWRISDSQNEKLSPSEILALKDVADNPPISYTSNSSIPELEQDLGDSISLSASFDRYGITNPRSVNDDIDEAIPVMQAIDKLSIDEDIAVEIEIDVAADDQTSIGSVYEVPSIHAGTVVKDDDGLASSSGGMQVGAGIAGRFIGSKRGRKLIEKMGVDPEQADLVQMISEVAIGFSVGGPAGAIVPLARRGGRDVSEKALEIMVERGWIEQSLADKITKHGLDRIASEGLPDEITRAAEATKDALLNEETKRRALEMGATFQERSLELAELAKDRASELAGTAKEQASRARERATELTGRIGDRWRRRGDGGMSDPFSSIPDPSTASDLFDDPFANVPSLPISDDPFADVSTDEDPFTGGLASASRGAKSAGKRITKTFRVDSKPRKKPETRQELISRAVPTSGNELLRILEDSPFSKDKNPVKTIELINMMEIDWVAQAKLAAKLNEALENSPGFEELLGEFDIPPMVITKNGATRGMFNREQMYQDPSRWNSIEGEYFPEYGFLAFPSRVVDKNEIMSAAVDWPMPTEDIIRHELSHTIHAMAMGRSRKARKKYEEDTAEQIDRMEAAIARAEQLGLDRIDMADYALNERDKELARMVSRYAATKKSEYIAELMTYIFPGKRTKFFMPLEAHFEMLSEFLDIPVEKLKDLHRKSSMAGAPFL